MPPLCPLEAGKGNGRSLGRGAPRWRFTPRGAPGIIRGPMIPFPSFAGCRTLAGILLCLAALPQAAADVSLPSIFGEGMVLQRDHRNPVWGWAGQGEVVTVAIAGQRHTAVTGSDGRWKVRLDPLPAGGPHTLEIKGENELSFGDVLVGEVWICSGQSNMQWSVDASNDAQLEKLAARFPRSPPHLHSPGGHPGAAGGLPGTRGRPAAPPPSAASRRWDTTSGGRSTRPWTCRWA